MTDTPSETPEEILAISYEIMEMQSVLPVPRTQDEWRNALYLLNSDRLTGLQERCRKWLYYHCDARDEMLNKIIRQMDRGLVMPHEAVQQVVTEFLLARS